MYLFGVFHNFDASNNIFFDLKVKWLVCCCLFDFCNFVIFNIGTLLLITQKT